METKITVSINLSAEVKYDKEVNIWVAHNETLGIFSQGHSEDDALGALGDAIKSYLEITDTYKFILNPVRKKDKSDELNKMKGI